MTATNHAVTGAAIAVAVNSPWALPLAFAVHFAMDAVPHFDFGSDHSKPARNFAFFDVAVAGVGSIFMAMWLQNIATAWIVLVSAWLCMSPDVVWGWRYFKYRDYKKVLKEPMSLFTRWHLKIQWSETRAGIIIEIVWFALVMMHLIARHHIGTPL